MPSIDWLCEECKAPWTAPQEQCVICGNRTRVPAATGTVTVLVPEWMTKYEPMKEVEDADSQGPDDGCENDPVGDQA